MIRRFGLLFCILALLAAPVSARHEVVVCGTTRETANETLFLHRQAVRARQAGGIQALAAAAPSANRDNGDIAIVEDTDGVVARQNQFSLDNNTLTFTPTAPNAAHYRYAAAAGGYDAAAASGGAPLAALDDDDSRAVSLPFAFPFFGGTYNQVFVNSDGNLTFTAGDNNSSERSLGRMTSGAPRIAPLFDDLDPSRTSGGVRVLSEPTRVVVSWVNVPEFASSGTGVPETFQVRLYPDGRIEFSYSGINPNAASAVVGIAPGNLQGATSLVDFRRDASGDYSAAVAERFGNTLAVDMVTVAQKFYATHEDAYDYLVVYNNMDIAAGASAVAFENTVRSIGTGFGTDPVDHGQQYGSASRLQAVLNMGNLGQYPADPNGKVPARPLTGDTPITIVSHETGHLFLAFASIRDASDPAARPMLGVQLAHWNFAYDSEASLMEGERIVDRGPGVPLEFLTTDTVQGYSPLDQYLMGFRAAAEVPDTFLVTGVPAFYSQLSPVRGFTFDGTRENISVNDVIGAEGRRTPDYTVAQRRFRFAFIMVVPQGGQPLAADLTKIETYRAQFEGFYAQASSGNGVADATLKRSMKLSLQPAAGVVAGATGTGTVTLAAASSADMTVQFQASKGNSQFPAAVTIPAGATSASFTFTGARTGVEDVLAVPGDSSYETAAARVQVADASLVKLVAVSGDRQVATAPGLLPDPIVVRLTDANNLAYPGARVVATASAGGSVAPAAAVTDVRGQAQFRWTPGTSSANQLQLAVESLPAVKLAMSAGSAVPVAQAVVNGASFAAGIAAGALETVFGVNLAGGQTAHASYPWPARLAGVRVLLNGAALPVLDVTDGQINFYVPADAPLGTGTLAVETPSGTQAATAVEVKSVQPGIFAGAVLHAGTAVSAVTTPVRAGDYIEIYCTGLGPTKPGANGLQLTAIAPTVFIGAVPMQPVFSGLAPGFVGLYQVNVQVPAGLAPGLQPLLMSVSLAHSNQINIAVQ
ncbi:MAG: hypothetical protein LAP87_13110 [Acidobacteriia bacterium]|nr:hypothetical protein [Terriglobia bacterium]